jgi:ABC-2 type transport system permease protein
MGAACWLGWQIEGNWTRPLLFAAYALAKPLAASLIILFMYLVATGGKTAGDLFAFMFVGNAFYVYVSNVLFGTCWVVVEDRELYQMLKYIYLTPLRLPLYLVARAATKLSLSTVGVAFLMVFGYLVLDVPISLSPARLLVLLPGLGLGLLSLLSLGLILAGLNLLMARHGWLLAEGTAGVFFLLSGAIYPIEVLPTWVRPISMCLPVTYWLELMRRALLQQEMRLSLSRFSNGELMGLLAVSAIGLAFLGIMIQRRCEQSARARGMIDWVSNY